MRARWLWPPWRRDLGEATGDMTTSTQGDTGGASPITVRTLVISQHEAVRHQLVTYLSRSPSLAVTGVAFSAETIIQTCPDVLVLDLSQLGNAELCAAIIAAAQMGARLIALASLRDPHAEALVVQAGGIYQLKAAGANGLAELVKTSTTRPGSDPFIVGALA